jgi:valyl-tRNA synthetase
VLSASVGLGPDGDDTSSPQLPDRAAWTLSDRWLLSRHQACLEEMDRALDGYRLADALRALHRFVWSEFCDWGLEAAKLPLYEGSQDERQATASLLAWVLERSLRMLHPFMPFVTEELWQRFGVGESVMIAPWPEQNSDHRDEGAEVDFGFAEAVVSEVRRFRKAHGLRDSLSLAVRVHPRAERRAVLEVMRPQIQRLAGVSTMDVLEEPGDPTGSARILVDGAELLIPLAGLFDPEVERSRLAKRIAEVEEERERRERKLSNEGFLSKAPAQVVEKERDRLSGLKEEAAALATQLDELGPVSR